MRHTVPIFLALSSPDSSTARTSGSETPSTFAASAGLMRSVVAGSTGATVGVAAPPANAQRTESGLASRVLRPGTGTEHPTATSRVRVHYTGWTTDAGTLPVRNPGSRTRRPYSRTTRSVSAETAGAGTSIERRLRQGPTLSMELTTLNAALPRGLSVVRKGGLEPPTRKRD